MDSVGRVKRAFGGGVEISKSAAESFEKSTFCSQNQVKVETFLL